MKDEWSAGSADSLALVQFIRFSQPAGFTDVYRYALRIRAYMHTCGRQTLAVREARGTCETERSERVEAAAACMISAHVSWREWWMFNKCTRGVARVVEMFRV